MNADNSLWLSKSYNISNKVSDALTNESNSFYPLKKKKREK